jgi:hypothetical protein
MGGEFGQRSEWNFASQLEWNVVGFESHTGIKEWAKVMNHLYQSEPALHELCTKPEGFRWVRIDDWQQSVLAYERIGINPDDRVLVILNMTPVDRPEYRIGLEKADSGKWILVDHSDKGIYWGRDREINGIVEIEGKSWENKNHSMEFSLPGLTVAIYKWEAGKKKAKEKAKAKVEKAEGQKGKLKSKTKPSKQKTEPVVLRSPVKKVKVVKKVSVKKNENSDQKKTPVVIKDKPIKKTTLKKSVSKKVASFKASGVRKGSKK